jgi:dTDP-4-amino-4,6-dideoxygalactose transaminase
VYHNHEVAAIKSMFASNREISYTESTYTSWGYMNLGNSHKITGLTVPRKRPQPVNGLLGTSLRYTLTGQMRHGDALQQFERAISQRLRGAEVRAVGSGRFALLLVLQALEIQPGATILLAAYNASCVPNALQAAGYKIGFLDICPRSLAIDPTTLPSAITPGTEAIIVTHMEGNPGPIDEVKAWAGKKGLRVIEDAAHALGATYNGLPVGSLGDGAIFSLGRGKHLNTLGGGLAVVSEPSAHKRLHQITDGLKVNPLGELMRNVVMEGVVATAPHPGIYSAIAAPALKLSRRLGFDPMTALFEDKKDALAHVPSEWKRRLSNLQASFGLRGLAAFDRALARRREIAQRLRNALKDVLILQEPLDGSVPAWLELTALIEHRDAFQDTLLRNGVDTQRTWMDDCNTLPAFKNQSVQACPQAHFVSSRALYLPTYASLTDRQVNHVIDAIIGAAAEAKP